MDLDVQHKVCIVQVTKEEFVLVQVIKVNVNHKILFLIVNHMLVVMVSVFGLMIYVYHYLNALKLKILYIVEVTRMHVNGMLKNNTVNN